jgi:hypothetical protein
MVENPWFLAPLKENEVLSSDWTTTRMLEVRLLPALIRLF